MYNCYTRLSAPERRASPLTCCAPFAARPKLVCLAMSAHASKLCRAKQEQEQERRPASAQVADAAAPPGEVESHLSSLFLARTLSLLGAASKVCASQPAEQASSRQLDEPHRSRQAGSLCAAPSCALAHVRSTTHRSQTQPASDATAR